MFANCLAWERRILRFNQIACILIFCRMGLTFAFNWNASHCNASNEENEKKKKTKSALTIMWFVNCNCFLTPKKKGTHSNKNHTKFMRRKDLWCGMFSISIRCDSHFGVFISIYIYGVPNEVPSITWWGDDTSLCPTQLRLVCTE